MRVLGGFWKGSGEGTVRVWERSGKGFGWVGSRKGRVPEWSGLEASWKGPGRFCKGLGRVQEGYR